MSEFSTEPGEAGPNQLEGKSVDATRGADLGELHRAPDPAGGSTLRWTLPACLLAWLLPGCGHLLVGRRGRALVFGLLIATLFFGGLALDGKVYRPVNGDPLSYLAAFGASGTGGLYVAAHVLDVGEGEVSAPYHEYGNTFTLVAGLLNLLVILDAFDSAVLRARASRTESEGVESAA